MTGEGRRRRDRTYSVVSLNEGVVDGDNLNVGVLDSVAEDDTSNAAEAVDADLDNHCDLGLLVVFSAVRRDMSRAEAELG